jgi:hypothetical protein
MGLGDAIEGVQHPRNAVVQAFGEIAVAVIHLGAELLDLLVEPLFKPLYGDGDVAFGSGRVSFVHSVLIPLYEYLPRHDWGRSKMPGGGRSIFTRRGPDTKGCAANRGVCWIHKTGAAPGPTDCGAYPAA